MGRIRVQSYAVSKSARELARYLGVKRIKNRGSRFRGRRGDIIINWGNVKNKLDNVQYINPIDSVLKASNKLSTLQTLDRAGVSIPDFCLSLDSELMDDSLWVARTDIYSHSGRGIVIGKPNELPNAPLYTKLIDKVAEYRAIVVNGKVVDFKQKKRRRDVEHNPYVWNLDGGYVFCRQDIEHPIQADTEAILAVDALGLVYGAVDIIQDEEGTCYVLEVNTAFGLEGTTTELVGNAIKEYINEL